MSSQAKVEANRSNAQQSTGPTSAEGRATSSRNAVSHGLNASSNTLFAADKDVEVDYVMARCRVPSVIMVLLGHRHAERLGGCLLDQSSSIGSGSIQA